MKPHNINTHICDVFFSFLRYDFTLAAVAFDLAQGLRGFGLMKDSAFSNGAKRRETNLCHSRDTSTPFRTPVL